MIVKALSRKTSSADRAALGISDSYQPEWEITVGKEYFVYIVSFGASTAVYGNATLYTIFDDYDSFLISPACLYEIVDPRASSFWEASYVSGIFTLQPKIFYDQPGLNEDLLDREQNAIDILLPIFKKMKEEFS